MSRTEDLSELGLTELATEEEIKAAYKRLAQVHHPDKAGNAASFIRVESAYRRLTSNQDEAKKETMNSRANSNLAQLVLTIITDCDTDVVNIITAMENHISGSIINLYGAKNAASKRITKHSRTLRRCKDKDTIIARVITTSITDIQKQLVLMSDEITMYTMMLAKIKEIEYDMGPLPVMDISGGENPP